MLAVVGCGPNAAGVSAASPKPAAAAESSYRAPPTVTDTRRVGEGRLLVRGLAVPGSTVRLSTPAGELIFNTADATGAWRLLLPSPPDVRLFGLSMIDSGRPVQAEGYLALTPRGELAQLRAGSGAQVFAALGQGIRILALDFDRKGGAVVSGLAPARSALSVTVDGAQRGTATADENGAYFLALSQPLTNGAHAIRVTGQGLASAAAVTIAPASPIGQAPFTAARNGDCWRIDWMTPGGGLQSTLLFDADGGAA